MRVFITTERYSQSCVAGLMGSQAKIGDDVAAFPVIGQKSVFFQGLNGLGCVRFGVLGLLEVRIVGVDSNDSCTIACVAKTVGLLTGQGFDGERACNGSAPAHGLRNFSSASFKRLADVNGDGFSLPGFLLSPVGEVPPKIDGAKNDHQRNQLNHHSFLLQLLFPEGYTTPVTSKKGVIGCESPKHGGTKPHPARFAALSLVAPVLAARMGGRKPCRLGLRRARSLTPVRAAALCESESAVVHQAQLEATHG